MDERIGLASNTSFPLNKFTKDRPPRSFCRDDLRRPTHHARYFEIRMALKPSTEDLIRTFVGIVRCVYQAALAPVFFIEFIYEEPPTTIVLSK